MFSLRSRIFLLIAATACANVADAADGVIAQSSRQLNSRTTQSSAVDTEVDTTLAHEWGLKSEEWQRFRELMRGPLGTYAPTLDPLTALGIEARSDDERRHYAELQVAVEGRRVEKLLAYQKAYDDAWARLRPSLQPIRVTAATPSARRNAIPSEGTAGRLAVFIKDGCAQCDARVRQLQSAGRDFDVYMVGSRQDDSQIRDWAARVGIDAAKVRTQTITLNHDAGRWLSLSVPGELPAVVTQVDGKWRRQ